MAKNKELTDKHVYREFNLDAINVRVQKMLDLRDQVMAPNVKNLHVKISTENRKTTALVPSVSLIPVADCFNCKHCRQGCYDVRNVCVWSSVQKSRANNSAILHNDFDRYFEEIAEKVKFYSFFRWHIGGDIVSMTYFERMIAIALATPQCQFLVFTKMFPIVDMWMDKNGDLPKNMHVIFSDWKGITMNNPHNLPVSSPLWKDGTTGPHVTDKRFLCPGDCSQCAEISGGCWGACKGDTILFEAH